MRVDRIQVGAFGRLENFDTGPESLEGLVVVLGPNEAGKSTLFSFLTTSLYGFQPATRERNPHVPWGSDEATGRITVRLDSDGCSEIARTLRSQPAGRLTVGGRTTDLRNQAVPWVSHVPRTVFRQVFAITLSELAGLDEETWARIQDRMIGSMGAADVLSARAVAEVLEREAGEIWRPNRRGKQRLRELRATLRELRGLRSEAQERDARVRRLVEERESIRVELHQLRERRQLDRAEVDRAQSLLPVRRQLERIAALRKQGGPAADVEGLPADPPGRATTLRDDHAEIGATLESVDRDIAEREETIARSAGGGDLLGRREEIVRLIATIAGSAPDRVRAVELEAEVADVEARLDVAGDSVLARPWRDVTTAALGAVAIDQLRERIGRDADRASTRPESMAGGPAAGIAAVTGLALLVWGLLGGGPIVAALGGAALAGALAWRLSRPGGRADAGDSEPGAPARSIAYLLREVPVRAALLEHPGESLLTSLGHLRELARRLDELSRAREAAARRVLSVDDAARALARSLGRDTDADADTVGRELDRDIRDAERLHDAAVSAERELPRLRLGREAAVERRERVASELGALTERVQALAPEAPERAFELARARLEAHRRARHLEDELLQSHPDLDALRAEIEELDRANASWSVDGAALPRTRARLEGHDEHIEELLTRGEALEAEAARLREQATVDAVDSEVESLREEEERLMRVRDRKWVVARLLREADRRFREEHQPDLVRRAGSYLKHLTGGRYERLIVDEMHGDHLFHLMGPTLPSPIPLAPPVSTGTLEQAYLSLRLAIVDHLDQGGERLPLFVDEVLVNWDGERRARGLEVLAGIAGTRQVFVFTCHPSVAAELEEHGGRVLKLEGR